MTSRYVDLALKLRREKTGEILLAAGGRFDRLLRRYTDEKPTTVHYIDVEESQVELIRWFAGWLALFRDGLPRDVSLAIAGGERRGGKTFAVLLCLVAAALEVPVVGNSPLLGWIVSVSYQERDEVDRFIVENLPSDWYTPRHAPEYRYILLNGASIKNVSADDPENLKRGRVDICALNEAQKMSVASLSNAIGGTIDNEGLALLAANPPKRQIGEWVYTLKQAIDDKRLEGARFFGFSAKDNKRIRQAARTRVGAILEIIDPRAKKADDEGLWLPVGDRAYPKWSHKLIGEPPPPGVMDDITARVTERELLVAFSDVAGADFQGRPHQAAVIYRIFDGADGPIYWIVDELIVKGTELHLSDAAYERGHTPESLVWIPDASGSFQDATHSGSTTSFELLRSQRWVVFAPTEIKRPDRSRHAKNPDVDQRLGLMYRVMEQARLRVAPHCAWTIESFKECPLGQSRYGRRRPFGPHAHITDAAGYPIVRLEPKIVAPLSIEPEELPIARFKRPGSDFY